jgi:Holliday junction resolvase RusA-like endonuclease
MTCTTLPASLRGDIDNRVKALNDLLVRHGVVEDDRFCRRLLIERGDVGEVQLTLAKA